MGFNFDSIFGNLQFHQQFPYSIFHAPCNDSKQNVSCFIHFVGRFGDVIFVDSLADQKGDNFEFPFVPCSSLWAKTFLWWKIIFSRRFFSHGNWYYFRCFIKFMYILCHIIFYLIMRILYLELYIYIHIFSWIKENWVSFLA